MIAIQPLCGKFFKPTFVSTRKPGQILRQILRHIISLMLGLAVGASSASAALKISPQRVVDDALSKGRQAKAEDLTAQRSYLSLGNALGALDLNFTLIPYYQYNAAQNLSGSANLLDRTLSLQAILSKKFMTGTTLSLEYDTTRQTSTLSQLAIQQSRPPTADMDVVTVSVRQPLVRDFFGYGERLAVEIAQGSIQSALNTRDKNIENIVLNAMTLFWNAFVAEQSLKENVNAREKYQQLVGNVRRKQSFNMTAAGELPRLQAELEEADQRVKSSSSDYLNAIDALKTAMQLQTTESIELEIPDTLPPVPKLPAKDIEQLRVIQIAQTNLKNAERQKNLTHNTSLPQVDVVARAASTGEAQDPGRSYAELVSTDAPTFYVGLEVRTPIDSYLNRALNTDAAVQLAQAQNELGVQRDLIRDQLVQFDRQVAANYEVANSTIDEVKQREREVRDLESAYRQGRQPLVELIRGYNDLFASQLSRANAIGKYHISLNQLAATRDELVPHNSQRK